MKTLVASLALLLLAGAIAPAQYQQINVPIGPSGSEGTLHLFLFDARRMTLKVIDHGDPGRTTYRDLDAAMEAHHCEAGCNGGPADGEGNPLGLVIADGRTFGQAREGDAETAGVLLLDGAQPAIKPAASYFSAKTATPRQLVQSGPFLVEDGRTSPDLDDRRIARRTFVLHDGNNRWAIGYAPPTTLHKLGRALGDPATFTEFQVATALSLGCGSFSGIWIRREHGPLYLKEIRTARNYLGLVRR